MEGLTYTEREYLYRHLTLKEEEICNTILLKTEEEKTEKQKG